MKEYGHGRFTGRVIVVVGASPAGIGGTTASRLASEGAQVVIGDINFDTASAVASDIVTAGGQAEAVRADVMDEASVAALFSSAERQFGHVDGLVNVAADRGGGDSNVVDIDLSIFDRVIALDLRGYLISCRYAIPAMLRAGGGAIVNISSIRGLSGTGRLVAYSCAKAALHALTRHIATRWGPDNIRCNEIAPGMIETPHIRDLLTGRDVPPEQIHGGVLVPRIGASEDIAAATAFLLSDEAGFITGQTLTVDGGELSHYSERNITLRRE